MTRARYDLADKVASFQFFNWMVLAVARGATRVIFDDRRMRTSKWTQDQIKRRLASILVPGAALGGLPVDFGDGGMDLASPLVEEFTSYIVAGGEYRRLRSVLPAATARYTITLRRTERRPERNSNEAAWRQFAEEIGAVVIEDWDVLPIGLLERVALYAGAEMNFFVTNGPMHLCSLTPYPMMAFGCPAATGAFGRVGVLPGEQLPWALPNQRLIWEPDELLAIRRNFKEWHERAADLHRP